MRIKLDRTVCDGFGVCGINAPETFSLDEWGYATLRDAEGNVPPQRQDGVRRAIERCPVQAISRWPRSESA